MEITQLHYFKTVAKFESFTRAAEKLHITQSAEPLHCPAGERHRHSAL